MRRQDFAYHLPPDLIAQEPLAARSAARMLVLDGMSGAWRDGTIRDLPLELRPDDLLVHRTRNTPKCATVVLLDMSGSMRYNGLYVDVKRMGLALQGLIQREYPGDYLQFIEVYTFARPRPFSEIVSLLPKPCRSTIRWSACGSI